MADTMRFDLVSPERRLASMEASAVDIPGAEGDMTAMPDHAPLITTLRPGMVRATGREGTVEFLVTGGFAEVTASGASVLAEVALPRAEVTSEKLNAMVAEANDAAQSAPSDKRDAAVKYAADLAAVAQALR